jgi:DNA polymerase I-like protein with 3'-5' exonuclease and polymerase domains
MIEFNEVIKIAGLQQCWIVLQVHDSILAECRKEDAELVAQILQHSMEKTTLLPGVDLVAVPSITTNLADQK